MGGRRRRNLLNEKKNQKKPRDLSQAAKSVPVIVTKTKTKIKKQKTENSATSRSLV
jgi:hypothetical protein